MNTFNVLSILLGKLSLTLVALAATQAVYTVAPTGTIAAQILPSMPTSVPEASVLVLAMKYVNSGQKWPYSIWDKKPIRGDVPVSEAPDVVARLMACESAGVNGGCGIDSNGKESCGVLQYQDQTWNVLSKDAGIVGSPNDVDAAVSTTLWAVENGYIGRWSCASLTKIIN